MKPDVKIAQHREYLMHGIRYLWLVSKSEMAAAENQVTSDREMVGRRVQILESQSADETPLRLQVARLEPLMTTPAPSSQHSTFFFFYICSI